MNNEKYNQIIDEAYENYNNYMTENFMETRWCKVELSPDGKSVTGRKCNREEFIIESKIQPGFSEKWGLKIEERKLSLKEEAEAYNTMLEEQNYNPKWQSKIEDIDKLTDKKLMTILQSLPGPSKLITITYNNETVEIYE